MNMKKGGKVAPSAEGGEAYEGGKINDIEMGED
jgi:hypothetical protein